MNRPTARPHWAALGRLLHQWAVRCKTSMHTLALQSTGSQDHLRTLPPGIARTFARDVRRFVPAPCGAADHPGDAAERAFKLYFPRIARPVFCVFTAMCTPLFALETASAQSGGAGNGARQSVTPASNQPGRADPQAGSRIAANGAPGGAAACVGCHGANGEGNAAAGFPALVGQPALYLERQMRNFSNGARVNPVMTPIAKALSEQQQLDVSSWYATLPVNAADNAAGAGGAQTSAASSAGGAGGATAGGNGKSGENSRLIEQGRILATQGDEQRRVQACANCHGPGGAGEAPNYPALAGQPISYFTAAMAEWKSGARKTDPSNQMPAIAKQLGTDQIAALGAYFASMPRSSLTQANNIPSGSSLKPAIAASSIGSGPPAQDAGSTAAGGQGRAGSVSGSGTEQGAPLTGGNQGPGGGGGTKAGNPAQLGPTTSPSGQQRSHVPSSQSQRQQQQQQK
jgi:cytochrome c553